MVGNTHAVNIMNHPILDQCVLTNNVYTINRVSPIRKDFDVNVFSCAAGKVRSSEGCRRSEGIKEDIAFQSVRIKSMPFESGIVRDEYSDPSGIG
jgi:hypothetical protein